MTFMFTPQVWIVVAAIVYSFFTSLFLIARMLQDNSIVDIAWGLGFIVASITAAAAAGAAAGRSWLLLAMVTLWGGRLAFHIWRRKRGKPEDFRYRQWREKWGEDWRGQLRSFLQIFMLQATALLVIASPLVVALSQPNLNTPFPNRLDLLGLTIWMFGLGFEAVGDAQLRRFKQDPANKGQLMTSGLWRYTRHPNYFGETVLWWGVWIITLNIPGTWWTVVGPITITFLLRFVSGVPMLEKKYDAKDDPAWEKYKKQTNTFIPGPVKSV